MFNDEALIRILVKAELVRDETRAGADVEGAGGGRGGGRSQSSVSSQRSEVRELQVGAVRCGAVQSVRSTGGLQRKGATPARGVGPVWVAASNETCL